MQSGNLEYASEMLSKIETSAGEVFGQNSFERGRALMSLAGCLERNDKIIEAEEKLRMAISLEGYGKIDN